MSKPTLQIAAHKEMTCDKGIDTLMPGKQLVYSLSGHIGHPAEPVVGRGERVRAGQLIAKAGKGISANVYASVSGIVSDIGPWKQVNGKMANSIIVENDMEYMEKSVKEKSSDYKELSKAEIIERIKSAGITGMGGAGFPTHIKLRTDRRIDYIIVNGAECETYITADFRLMLEMADKIVKGIEVLQQLFPGARAVIAIEDNKTEAINTLRKYTGNNKRISIKKLLSSYPQGAERMLINTVAKRKVPYGKLPTDAGCIVNNVQTVAAICDAVVYGRPVTGKIITVSGKAIKKAGNYRVLTGMLYSDIIEKTGGICDGDMVICGGTMMGTRLYDTKVPVTVSSSSLVCIRQKDYIQYEKEACIKCCSCISVCPQGLYPLYLKKYADRKNYQSFRMAGGMNCIGCGSCSYICPAKRELTASFKLIKGGG